MTKSRRIIRAVVIVLGFAPILAALAMGSQLVDNVYIPMLEREPFSLSMRALLWFVIWNKYLLFVPSLAPVAMLVVLDARTVQWRWSPPMNVLVAISIVGGIGAAFFLMLALLSPVMGGHTI